MKWRDRFEFVLTLVGVIAVIGLWSTWLHFPEALPEFVNNAITVLIGIPLYLAMVAFSVLAIVLVIWIFWRGLTASEHTRRKNGSSDRRTKDFEE